MQDHIPQFKAVIVSMENALREKETGMKEIV